MRCSKPLRQGTTRPVGVTRSSQGERRRPEQDELAELVTPDVRFVERPNLVRDHIASGDAVVMRMRWSGELAIDVGPWPAGTRMVER